MQTIVRRSERINESRAEILAEQARETLVMRLSEFPGFGNGVGSLGLVETDREPDRV
jgi:hypothetical protein